MYQGTHVYMHNIMNMKRTILIVHLIMHLPNTHKATHHQVKVCFTKANAFEIYLDEIDNSYL